MASVSWNSPDVDLESAMLAGAEHLLDEANRKAPIEHGDLIRSGIARASDNEAAVGYNTPYAVRQHEELGYQHDEGREAKWLENALNNNREAIMQTIADQVRRELG